MILVDTRSGSADRHGNYSQKELMSFIQRAGVRAQLSPLEYGDACFEGNGPDGRMCIGVERKALSDILNCIDDSRYAAHQRPGMLAMYQKDILVIEGVWKPDITSGYLMECVASLTWRPFRYRSQMVRYSKLFRYLLTIQFAGTAVIVTRDIEHTAYNICECFHYFQKKWADHTSLMEVQKLNLPELRGKPSLVRRWANDLEGVGVKGSMAAEKIFPTPFDLASSDELSWMKVPGIGAKLARRIIKEIRGSD